MTLKATLLDKIKIAMKNKEKDKLTTLRMFSAAIKQIEVDKQKELTEDESLKVLTTMIKQRKEAFKQFTSANREDLASKEATEITILEEFLPEQITDEQLLALIQTTIASTGAKSIKDMGKVMKEIRPQIQGKADPAQASALIKAQLQQG